MAITYVGGLTAQITAVTPATQSISLTSLGLASGDFVLVSYTTAAASDGVLSGKISTSGYTFVTELYGNGSTNDANMAVFQKFMGSTPDTSLVVVGKGSSSLGATVHVTAFRGVNSTTPLDVTPTTATGTGSGNTNPPAITPATSGNVIAIFGHSATSTTLRTYTTASTSYMSEFLQTNSAGSTYASTSGAGYVTGQSAGVSYDPAAWALSTDNAGNSWNAVTLALRPAPTPKDGSATLSGLSGLTTSGTRSRITSISISGTGSTVFIATRNRQVSLSFSSVGSFSASGVKAKIALATLLGGATLDALGARSSSVSTSFLGVGSLDTLGGLLRASVVSLVGSSVLGGTGFKTKTASLILSSSGNISTLVIKRKSAIFTGFNSEATRTTNLGDVRVTEDGNIRVTTPLVYNEAEATLVASSSKTQFNALAYVKQNGIWKRMTPNAKHLGIWKEAQRMYKKISSSWKRIY